MKSAKKCQVYLLPRTSLTAFWNSVLLPMIARVSRTSTEGKKGKIKDRGSTRSDTGQYVFGFVNRSYFFKANFLPIEALHLSFMSPSGWKCFLATRNLKPSVDV